MNFATLENQKKMRIAYVQIDRSALQEIRAEQRYTNGDSI